MTELQRQADAMLDELTVALDLDGGLLDILAGDRGGEELLAEAGRSLDLHAGLADILPAPAPADPIDRSTGSNRVHADIGSVIATLDEIIDQVYAIDLAGDGVRAKGTCLKRLVDLRDGLRGRAISAKTATVRAFFALDALSRLLPDDRLDDAEEKLDEVIEIIPRLFDEAGETVEAPL